jgi:hypothetical protein
MQRTTIKRYCLALILASALPPAACSDDDETPTSPTQAGPPVAATPTPPPTPEPTPTPPPSDDRPIVSITGDVVNLVRSGTNDLDVQFRIDDRTIARAKAGTPVVAGSRTGDTDFIRNGQTVTVEGRRDNGFLDATRVTIVSDVP